MTEVTVKRHLTYRKSLEKSMQKVGFKTCSENNSGGRQNDVL